MTIRKMEVERWAVTVRLEQAYWSQDYAELTIEHSDGTAEITREEARAIAKMLLEWAERKLVIT